MDVGNAEVVVELGAARELGLMESDVHALVSELVLLDQFVSWGLYDRLGRVAEVAGRLAEAARGLSERRGVS